MKGDFTRFTDDPCKHYTRVLKQQGRVDLDADWNEAVEILTRRDRVEATDVIGRCGAPIGNAGFRVELGPDDEPTVGPGRIWVDGRLCELEGPDPVPLTEQEELPGYELPDEDGIYLAYLDVWDRHVTYLEDPDIREPALGGPDTATRVRTVAQVRLLRVAEDGPLEDEECRPYPADPSTGRLTARAEAPGDETDPCAVPEGAGYTGLENRLYRVEIHDDGRDESGAPGARPVTFKWSRDNGSVVLPVADENGIDGDTVTLGRLGFDEVLTVQVGDLVEILGDETELHGRPGTLAQIVPDGIDRADLQVELDLDVSAHADETRLKMRRWDHRETEELALIDGALPLPAGPFALEDGVVVEFEPGGTYHTGDYWTIPARTRQGTVLWPREGTPPVAVPLLPRGISHHYCTLALVRRTGGAWIEPRDCRPLFPPLTEVDEGCCCVSVEPGEDLQQALDTVVAAGGGCVALCEGVHEVAGPLWLRDAVDVTLHGEGAASVLLFAGPGEDGRGGLVIENGRRVAVEDLFVASGDVPALVTVRHGAGMQRSRRIALRRLILLNLAESNRETDLACAVRLGHADGVTVEECRIAAEVGVLSLWGDALPGFPEEGGEEPGEGEEGPGEGEAVRTLDFEELEPGAEIRVGDGFTESGVTVTGEPYVRADGETTEDGFARVQGGEENRALQLNNINLAFAPPEPYSTVRLTFVDFGGRVNLRVNDELREAADLADLDGQLVGGVRVGASQGQALLRLDAETRSIASLAIGGQELLFDDVVFRGPAEPPAEPPVLEYGEGVADLRMRDTTVRFRDFGVLAARAAGWQIDRADVRPYDVETWSAVRGRLEGEGEEEREEAPGGAAGSARARQRRVLAALEEVFATPGDPRGHALLAFRWERCAVRHSTLGGRHGLVAWWWLGGGASGNDVSTGESGCHAFWLYEATWGGSTVRTADGLALSVAGCCRARVEHNRLRGPVGVADVPFADSLDTLETIVRALLRGYGTGSAVDTAILQGIVVDESFDLMGLGPLMDALQPVVDEASGTPGVPVAWYLAGPLLGNLAEQGGGGLLQALPLIDLDVAHNDLACGLQGVTLDGFLPLGGIRLTGNRIHTTTGQAVRVETNPLYANGHLVVFLVRLYLRLLADLLAEAAEDADGPLAAVLEALQALVEGWREGAEALFDLDFRIEGNTIRSLRTAIESNLFELSVLTNHVTLQERPVAAPAENRGLVFGRVLTAAGDALVGATVRAVGTERAVVTDENGAYRMVGMPAGSWTLRASRAGFAAATTELSLEAGEQVEVNFTLRPQGTVGFLGRTSFSDAVVGARTTLPAVRNEEIVEVIEALEGSAAFEPLAVALREGAHTLPSVYAAWLAAENGPLSSAETRADAADAAALVRAQTSDPEVRQAAGEASSAVRANDRTRLVPVLTRFVAALQRYTDSQGILVKGVGGRIVENQVVVPADVRTETEALGGVQVSVNLAFVQALAVLGAALARFLGGGTEDETPPVDPLLGITDTLIDTNEIVGGVGHGVSVQGVAGQPDFVRDLRIRGNQVRGMAGAGVFVNEHALVVGLDVTDNHVSGCGRPAGFARQPGGIVVRTAVVCGLRGNRVVRCGEDVRFGGVYGIDLDALYGLALTANEVQANGSGGATADDGGVRLVEVYGAAQAHDNVIAFNRGLGLSWINSARVEEPALLPPFLVDAANDYLRMGRTVDQLVEEEQASLRGNVLKSVAEADFPVFQLLNLRAVSFCGNTCHAETTGAPLGEIQQVTRGIVGHNQTQTDGEVAIAIKKMADGVVLGNVGNRPIQLQASAGVESAFNVPPVI